MYAHDNFLPEIQFEWKRPSDVEFPSMWRRFETKSKDGRTYKIRIEDALPERYPEMIVFMTKYYFNDVLQNV